MSDFEIGQEYQVCHGFAIIDEYWSKATGVWNIGDTFICHAIDDDGASIAEGGEKVATYSELNKGFCKLILKRAYTHTDVSLTIDGNEVDLNLPLPRGGLILDTSLHVIPSNVEVVEETVTGGSSPSYYRKSIMLPTTADRTVHVQVDLEAFDVSNAWDMNANAFNVFKSTVRGDNKPGVDHEYALDKQLWFTLTEKLRRDLITTEQFWQMAVALGISKDV